MDKQETTKSGRYFIWLCLVIAAAIFLLDISIPLGVAGGVPYVLVVLISFSIRCRRCIIYFAILCSVLTVLGYFTSPVGGEHWKVLANRFLALFAIWVVALLGLARRRARDALKEAHDLLEERVERRTRELTNEVAVRKSAVEALSESEAKYRVLFEEANESIYLIDAETGDIIDFNDRAFDFLGYTKEEFEGLKIADFEVIQSQEEVLENIRKINENGSIKFETRHRTKDGDIRDVLVSSRMISIGDNPFILSLISDITELKRAEEALQKAHDGLETKVEERTKELRDEVDERKRAEEALKESLGEKEVLLKEVHHRVKNNLQVIMSILSLQGRYIDDEAMKEVFNESQNRIRSMAIIHEKLYQSSNLASIDFADYIKNLTASIFSSYKVGGAPVKFLIDIPEVVFDIDTCVSLGLIINELCTNSLKYAFLDGNGGEISIELKGCKDERCVLIVKDNGIGLPEGLQVEEAGTMGHQLVDTLIAQLGGELKVSGIDGSCFEIAFPSLR